MFLMAFLHIFPYKMHFLCNRIWRNFFSWFSYRDLRFVWLLLLDRETNLVPRWLHLWCHPALILQQHRCHYVIAGNFDKHLHLLDWYQCAFTGMWEMWPQISSQYVLDVWFFIFFCVTIFSPFCPLFALPVVESCKFIECVCGTLCQSTAGKTLKRSV